MGASAILVDVVPTAIALVAMGYLCFYADLEMKWRFFAASIGVAGILTKFVPPFETNPVIPLLLQAFIGFWMLIHMKME